MDRSLSQPDLVSVPQRALQIIESAALGNRDRDKLLWFVHDLSTKRRDGFCEKGAPVHSKFFRTRYSMRGKRIIDELVRLKVIEKCGKHSAGNRASHYRFSSGIRKKRRLVPVKIKTRALIDRRGSRTNYVCSQLAGAGLPDKFWHDLSQIVPRPDFEPACVAEIQRMVKESKQTESMKALFERTLKGDRRLSVNHSRMTSHLCLLPSGLRRLFLVGGQPAVELDLKSSHPAFLAKIFEPTLRSCDREIHQHGQLVRMIQEGNFYEAFEHCWTADRWKFLNFAVPKKGKTTCQLRLARAEFMCLPARKGIKFCWQLIINCSPTFHDSMIMKELNCCLPYFTKRLNALKGSTRDALGKQLRRREAMLVNELAKCTDQPCATIYDGWLSNKPGVEDLLKAAPAATKKHFGFEHLPVTK